MRHVTQNADPVSDDSDVSVRCQVISGHAVTQSDHDLSSCVSHRSQDPTESLLPGSGLVSGLVSPNHSAPITGDTKRRPETRPSHGVTHHTLIVLKTRGPRIEEIKFIESMKCFMNIHQVIFLI